MSEPEPIPDDEWIAAQIDSIQEQEVDRLLMVMMRRIEKDAPADSEQLKRCIRRLNRLAVIDAPLMLMIREWRLIGRQLAALDLELQP